jgi:hypothetical protein
MVPARVQGKEFMVSGYIRTPVLYFGASGVDLLRLRQIGKTLVATMLVLFGTAIPRSASGQSATAEDARFQVHPNRDGIHLEIYTPVPLSDVLRFACKQAGVTCTGLDLLSKESLQPMIVDGKFTRIVRQILEGTDVNFEYAHSDGQTRPKLTILRRSSTGQASLQVSGTPASSLTMESDQVAQPDSPSLEATTPAAAPAANVQETSVQETSHQSPPTAGQTEWRTAAEMMYRGGYATAATPSEFLPFPGPDGNPIPAVVEKPEFLPFPDQFGRPVPVTPVKPGSPFPMPADQQPPK